MDDKQLIFIAFIGSMAGMLLLYMISENLNYSEKTIDDIINQKLEETIQVNGLVSSIYKTNSSTFIKISQLNFVDVVVFDNIDLVVGENVEVIGKQEDYNGKKEILAQRIRIINESDYSEAS